MAVTTVTYYVTSDGRNFSLQADAIREEAEYQLTNTVFKVTGPSPTVAEALAAVLTLYTLTPK